MSKEVFFTGAPGKCIIPSCEEDSELHEFGLYDENNNQVKTAHFTSLEIAVSKAQESFPEENYTVKDLTEEWYVKKALEYRMRIKKIHPSFKITNIVLDMSQLYYKRSPENWYTFIPFTYNGQTWNYRETASEEWIHKASEIRKENASLDDKITNTAKDVSLAKSKNKDISKVNDFERI